MTQYMTMRTAAAAAAMAPGTTREVQTVRRAGSGCGRRSSTTSWKSWGHTSRRTTIRTPRSCVRFQSRRDSWPGSFRYAKRPTQLFISDSSLISTRRGRPSETCCASAARYKFIVCCIVLCCIVVVLYCIRAYFVYCWAYTVNTQLHFYFFRLAYVTTDKILNKKHTKVATALAVALAGIIRLEGYFTCIRNLIY